jgi:hypothetical protein
MVRRNWIPAAIRVFIAAGNYRSARYWIERIGSPADRAYKRMMGGAK